MAGIAPPFPGPKVHISSHFSPPRRAPGAETCINRAATVKFTLSQLLPTIGRRAGNIPASDPDTHPDLPRSRDQCRHKRKRQDPAVGPWRETARRDYLLECPPATRAPFTQVGIAAVRTRPRRPVELHGAGWVQS